MPTVPHEREKALAVMNAPRGRRVRPKPLLLNEDITSSPTRTLITFDGLTADGKEEPQQAVHQLSPSGSLRKMRRASSSGRLGGRLTPLPCRVPKGGSSLRARDDMYIMGTTADAVAFYNAGCLPKTPAVKKEKPGYLPSLPKTSSESPEPENEAKEAPDAEGPPKSHVDFCPTPMNTVHCITPYSKVYGQHPRLFNYNRKGEMQLNDAGVAALMDEPPADLDVD
ncbi:unnamed protein product [Effrenium voratum]|nr:unnamed protein product [Effrenium voratum]